MAEWKKGEIGDGTWTYTLTTETGQLERFEIKRDTNIGVRVVVGNTTRLDLGIDSNRSPDGLHWPFIGSGTGMDKDQTAVTFVKTGENSLEVIVSLSDQNFTLRDSGGKVDSYNMSTLLTIPIGALDVNPDLLENSKRMFDRDSPPLEGSDEMGVDKQYQLLVARPFLNDGQTMESGITTPIIFR